MRRVVSGCIRHVLPIVWLLWCASALAAGADAAPAGPLPELLTFFRNPDVSDVRLSPSGEWLAMTVGNGSKRRALAVVDANNKQPPSIVALFDDADVRSFRWVDDERLVFNIYDGLSGGGEQRFGPGLYSVHRDGSNLRLLINPRREFMRSVSPSRRETLEWNHELLSVPRDGGHEVIVGEDVYSTTGQWQHENVLRLDVDTGRVRSLANGSPDHAKNWLFDPQGEPRVVVAEHEGVTTTWWRAPGQDGWTLIATDPSQRRAFIPFHVDASGHLFVATGSVLRRFDFASGQPDKEAFVSTPGFEITGSPFVDAGGSSVRGLRLVTDAETTVWFDPKLAAIQKTVDAKLPGHTNLVSPCSLCNGTPMVLVSSWSDQDPGSYWLYRPADDIWQLVGRARSDVEPRRMATLDFFRIKARDGVDLPVWLTTPPKTAPGGSAATHPAVVLVHGGPWVRGTYWRWNAEAQFLASRGYVVIEPEYRGSTGFGFAHFHAGWKQWEGTMQDDVADAVRWAEAKGLVDPGRVCIAGASYGGYATLMGLARYPDLYRCGVAWVAVTDPRLLFMDSWESDMSDEGRKYDLPTLLGDPQKDAELLRSAAPVERAGAIRAPLLLAFGRDDRRVPLVHGTRMREALQAQGRDPEWVVYDGEGHGWLKVENRVDFWSRVERFLDRNLKSASVSR